MNTKKSFVSLRQLTLALMPKFQCSDFGVRVAPPLRPGTAWSIGIRKVMLCWFPRAGTSGVEPKLAWSSSMCGDLFGAFRRELT
jgi:hypothetical protein